MGIFSTGSGQVRRDAQASADARQGRGANLTRLIDGVYSDPRREQQTQDFMGAMRAQLADSTDRGFARSARRTKFATARQGLTGGSVDLSRQTHGLEDLFRRRLSNEAQVQDAGNELRTQDMATRQSLINSAYGVADTGQDALRSLLGRRAGNAAQLRSMWPQFADNAASAFSDAFGQRRELQSWRQGLADGGIG